MSTMNVYAVLDRCPVCGGETAPMKSLRRPSTIYDSVSCQGATTLIQELGCIDSDCPMNSFTQVLHVFLIEQRGKELDGDETPWALHPKHPDLYGELVDFVRTVQADDTTRASLVDEANRVCDHITKEK